MMSIIRAILKIFGGGASSEKNKSPRDNSTIYSTIQEILNGEQILKVAPDAEVSAEGEVIRVKYANANLTIHRISGQELQDHLKGLAGFVQHFAGNKPTPNSNQLFSMIEHMSATYGIVIEPGFDSEDRIKTLVLNLTRSHKGVIFFQSSIYAPNGMRILGRPGDDDYYMAPKPVSSEQEERKQRSIKILTSNSIPFMKHLPVIVSESEIELRSKVEICERAMALCLVAAYAEGLEKEFIDKKINEFQIANCFSPKEKYFLALPSFDTTIKAQFLWRYESLWVLLWSLGYVKNLETPTKICDVPFSVKTINDKGRESFIQNANLRSKTEILDQADLIYRYHWATTEARIKNNPMPGNLDNSVVYERHYALNWLISTKNQAWDDISTDT